MVKLLYTVNKIMAYLSNIIIIYLWSKY